MSIKSIVQDLAKKYLTDTTTIGVPAKPVDRTGWYINPITAQFVRILISLPVGLILAFTLMMIDTVTGTNTFGFGSWFLIGLFFAAVIAWNEQLLNIPANHVGIMTFFGSRYPIYLKEGDYYWTGGRLLISVTEQALPGAKNVQAGDGEEQGRVFVGKRVLRIWNDTASKSISLMLPARAGSTVKINFTVILTTLDPMKWALADDPVLQVAEQARAGVRKSVTFFRDTDVSGAKSAVTALVAGNRVIVTFITRNVHSLLPGTMMQDKSGIPMYDIIPARPLRDPTASDLEHLATETAYDAAEETLKEVYRQKILRDGNPDMLKAVAKQTNKVIEQADKEEVVVTILNIEESLDFVLIKLGAGLDNIILSDAQLSEAVRNASEAAASEGAQREQQLTSATTQAEAMKILAKARDGTTVTELDQIITAAADGNKGVNVIHVTGAGAQSDLVRAATAAGQLIGGKK